MGENLNVVLGRADGNHVGLIVAGKWASRVSMPNRVQWWRYEFDWALSRGDFGRHIRLEQGGTWGTDIYVGFDWPKSKRRSPESPPAPALQKGGKGIFLRVTPVWSEGGRGASYEGHLFWDEKENKLKLRRL